MEGEYDCPRCWGTGQLESSDSTEDGWWDCRTCAGTGKLADRRRPDPQLRGAVDELERLRRRVRDLEQSIELEAERDA